MTRADSYFGDASRGTAVDLPLDLPLDGQRAPQEVDVAELQAGSLPQPQPGEGAHRDKGPEVDRRDRQRLRHLLGCRDPHLGLGLGDLRRRDRDGRIVTDQPRPYRGREAHPDVVEAGPARRGSETPLPLRARQALGLHPLPDVVLGHGADRHVGEADRGKHLVGAGCGTGSPVLRRRPLTPPLREGDLAGGRIDPVAANDSCCRLVKPPLRVDLPSESGGRARCRPRRGSEPGSARS